MVPVEIPWEVRLIGATIEPRRVVPGASQGPAQPAVARSAGLDSALGVRPSSTSLEQPFDRPSRGERKIYDKFEARCYQRYRRTNRWVIVGVRFTLNH